MALKFKFINLPKKDVEGQAKIYDFKELSHFFLLFISEVRNFSFDLFL